MQAEVMPSTRLRAGPVALTRPGLFRMVSRTVLALGMVSLVTDVSSEMVATILPLYLLVYLHFSPLQLGIVDGLYQGSSAFVRLLGGLVADRWRRYKEVAGVGTTSEGNEPNRYVVILPE